MNVNSVTLSWNEVSGTTWYDIYKGEEFVTRLSSDARSYTLEHLPQETSFSFVLGARDGDNNTLDAEMVNVTTSSFSGTYVWTNPTARDNNGKVKDITFIASLKEDEEHGQYMEISFPSDGQNLTVFPLQDLHSEWDWIDFDADMPAAYAYRANCEKFNTLSITPSSFRTSKIYLANDSASVDISSRIFGITFTTTTTYDFYLDEEGNACLRYNTDGSAIARSALFKNPENKSDPYTYILKRTQEI